MSCYKFFHTNSIFDSYRLKNRMCKNLADFKINPKHLQYSWLEAKILTLIL